MRVLTCEDLTGTDQIAQPRWSPWSSPAPRVVFQLGYTTDHPLYVGLDRTILSRYARALSRAWRLLGLGRGDHVALFDFGTSPLVFLASASYTPYLRRGAAEHLGCLPLCNDGEPTMAARSLEILRFVRPRVMFIRGDCLVSWVREVEARAFPADRYLSTLVVTDNEAVLPERQRQALEERLKLPVVRLFRVDLALFFAVECPDCRGFHTWDDLYRVKVLDEETRAPVSAGEVGLLAMAPRFAGGRNGEPIYLSPVRARQRGSGCPQGAADRCFEILP